MSQRCISPFCYADKVYSGGALIADDDPILQTHREYFAPVSETAAVTAAATETATAVPGAGRPGLSKSAKKATQTQPASSTGGSPESQAAQNPSGSDAADPAATSGSSSASDS